MSEEEHDPVWNATPPGDEPVTDLENDAGQKNVKAVNIMFLIIVTAPELISALGLFSFIRSYSMRLLVSQVLFVMPVIVYLIVFRRSISFCRFKKISISNLLLCILFYICMMPVMTFLNLISLLYSKNAITSMILGVSGEMPLVVGMIVIALIPAFCEELTYRGVVYNTYREVNPLGAVLLSGALFGLLHGNLNQVTYAIALGIVFALLVEATDSIFSSMIVHFVINTVSTLVIYFIPKALEYLSGIMDEARNAGDTMTMDLISSLMGTDSLDAESFFGAAQELTKVQILYSLAYRLIPASIGGALAFFLYRFIARRCGRWDHIRDIFKNNRKKGRLIDLPLVVSFILLALIITVNELIIRGVIAI